MKEKQIILGIDQGTTSTKVILFDREGTVQGEAYREIDQIYPHPGWVEHNPADYRNTFMDCCGELFQKTPWKAGDIAAIGITNQRETTILWDKYTGEPEYNAIVWQCRRSAPLCDALKSEGWEPVIQKKTGLVVDAYFSSTKIRWIIDNVPGVREKILQGRILFGTVDTWLIWHLSGGKYHVTDCTNASRTLLFNIYTQTWDEQLLKIFKIPRGILPDVKPSSGEIAYTAKNNFFGEEIPIAGVAGDQHAATFGQTCFTPGMAKNTYGTSLALFMNTGEKPVASKSGLTTNLGWNVGGKTEYALEGVVFIGGAAIQWLKDGLKIIDDAAECSMMAEKTPDTQGVYMVPAFTGLCAPYWDMYARGLIIGITRGTEREHIARAALESIAYQTRDVMDAMANDFGRQAPALRVDGGTTRSDFLMQFQADVLGLPIEIPQVTEMAALGAAYMAGLGVGFWKTKEEVAGHWKVARTFEPAMDKDKRDSLYDGWQKAVRRSFGWAK